MHTVIRHNNNNGEEKNTASTRIAFAWLLHLRWGAVAAQILLVLIAFFFLEITLPVWIISGILAFEIISNFLFVYLKQKETPMADWIFILVMFLDTALLSLLLYYTGGPMNPFTFLYLVHITLGAILMPPRWTWTLAFFTTGCYATLFYLPAEGSLNQPCHPEPSMLATLSDPLKIHLQGMWVAFAVTAFFIVFFVSRIQLALSRHQKTLADLQEEKTKSERMASLATLAAGAAHEFSTPLSTIAVAAGEMLHTLKKNNRAQEFPELYADVTLIREQVKRCKDILFHMSADAGEHMGEPFTDFTLDELMENLINSFPDTLKNQVHYTNKAGDILVRMPLRTLRRIVRGLIKNGLDAAPSTPVLVECRKDATRLYIEVTDNGSGMAPDVAARAAEPFFTTKEPGKGLGLGLFLAKSAAERFGGGLSLISEPSQGSKVTLFFALQQIKTDTPEVHHG